MSQQGYEAFLAGGGTQSEATVLRRLSLGAARTSRHSSAMSQDARLAVGRGHMRGPKSARSRRSRAAFAGGGAHGGIGPGPFPMLPPGAAAGFWDSTTPPPQEKHVRGDVRKQNPMEVNPVQGNAPRKDYPPRRERARAGVGGVTANPTAVPHR